MRISWTEPMVEREIRRALRRLGLARMPTARELTEIGMGPLTNQIARRGGFDAWADRLGLLRSEHASRVGWAWEEWVAREASQRGMAVEKRGRVKEAYDLRIGGKTVDVKVANGARIAGGTQWTWRNGRAAHVVEFYVLIGLEDGMPPVVFVVPASAMPLTCATTRKGPASYGKRAEWKDRWDLLKVIA